MARTAGRLTALKVDRVKAPNLYLDGAGLYLQVTGDGGELVAKSWVYRYMLRGKSHDMGLGSLSALGLADARTEATRWRRVRQEGRDPIETRKAERARAALAAVEAIVFRDCSEKYIDANEVAWKSTKHRALWRSTLKRYAEPVIGALPIQAIDTGLVLKVLEPIWTKKPETASRVRGRIEAVLNYATARGWRAGPNPALWRGHLDKLLPARGKVRKVKHHAALPYDDLPGFMTLLRVQAGVAARALEFTILTAARTGEVIGARHSEITGNVWVVPQERMKVGREHRVPLSPRALEIIETLKKQHGGEFVFAGAEEGRHLSNMAMLMLLERMKRGDVTVHGFRSAFRDWTAERTSYPSHVAEMALAHAIENKVEAAYRRGDLFDKRTKLMEAWAAYCASGKPARGEVVPMQRRG